MTDFTSPWALHQSMTDRFLTLARDQYTSSGQVDPDVQVGLGTLYYMMGDYIEARECWVAALGERPNVRTRLSVCAISAYSRIGLPPVESAGSHNGQRREPGTSGGRVSACT